MIFSKLHEVAEVNPRAKGLALKQDDPVSFVPMAAVSEQTRSVVAPQVRSYGEVSKGYTYFEEGDVIIAKITPCFENGKIALADGLPHPIAFGSTEYHVVRAGKTVHNRYLFYLLQSPYVLAAGAERMKGAAGQKRVPAEFLKDLEIPVPPLTEQKRIAAILDAADELRTKRRESLAQLDTLLQSTFIDLFGDPVINPKEWDSPTVDEICRLVRGSSPRPKGDPRFFGGTVPRLMVADITRDGFWVTPRIDSLTEEGAKRSRPVEAGAVVMAVSGDVGVVATVQVPCCVHDGFVAFLDIDETAIDTRFLMFLFHFMKSTHTQRKAGAIFQNLTTKDIKAMKIPMPPIELQRKFGEMVLATEEQRKLILKQAHELDSLFGSLQSYTFRGELSET